MIVNNGSTDHTDQVIASFADRLPIQSVLEPKSGKNYALNAGLDRVEGDLTVLTDDDVFPAPDWLVHLRKAADELPEYSMFGGRIIPRWEVAPPAWIQWINLGPIFTTTPPSMKEGPIPAHLIFGPNMAIRSNIFQSGIRFDSSIGPSRSKLSDGKRNGKYFCDSAGRETSHGTSPKPRWNILYGNRSRRKPG